MARHIDADKIKYHKLSVCEGHGLNFEYTVAYKHEVDAITTAEVVSKDIFGLWKELAEKSAEEIETLKDTNEHLAVLLEEAKQEVAREIFEEIEKLKGTKYDWNDYVEWDEIAELKKKYTDEVPEMCCEKCQFYDTYRKDQPCASCVGFCNFEKETECKT